MESGDSWERKVMLGQGIVKVSNNLGRKQFFLFLGFNENDLEVENKIIAFF